MYKKIVRILLLATLASLTLVVTPRADDLAQKRSCESCGMDRKAYGYSRMLTRFADGSQVATCSLNCMVVELEEHKGLQVEVILVADRDTRELIDARQAFWVMGGDKRGVMTMRPKWAFAGKVAADAFLKAHGGALIDWETALKAAVEDAPVSKR